MAVVRISILHVPADRCGEVEQMMREAESALSGIKQLHGLIHYYAGIDRAKSQLTNISVWASDADAQQLATFQPMLDLAKQFMMIDGLSFTRPIPNFEVLWDWKMQ
jgi:hypothetical protein